MSSLRLIVVAVAITLGLFLLDRTAAPLHAATIQVSGSITNDTTWSSGNIYVIADSDVTVNAGVTLVIQPGVIVKFRGDGPGSNGYGVVGNQRNLFVDGTLIADGTPENPIYFTSLHDDIVGGDTNNDSANTVPVAGNWGRIEFRNTSAASLLDNVVIRYAGATDYNSNGSYDWPIYYGAIVLQDASPTISNSTLSRNAKWGIYCSESIAPGTTRPSILNNVFTANASYAVSVDTASFPTLSGNTLTNNGGNGMRSAAEPLLPTVSGTRPVSSMPSKAMCW